MASFASGELYTEQLKNVKILVQRAAEESAPGIVIGPVFFESKDVNAGVGVFAKEFIAKGGLLVQIPYNKCISVDRIVQCPALSVIFLEQPQLLSFVDEVLAIGLMFGKLCREQVAAIPDLDEQVGAEARMSAESHCPWYHHIRSLPATFNTTLYWSDDELLELKGCMTFHLTQLMKRQIDQDWEAIHSHMARAYPTVLGGATKQHYMWALSIIYSRAVGITRLGVPHRIIPPIIDMANHDPCAAAETADTFEFDDVLDVLKFIACCDRNAQDECCAVYGQYPNSKLAYTYGFVLHPNPHQAIDLWTRLSPSSFAADRKRLMLEQHSLTAQQTYDFTGTLRKGYVSPALLATIRVIQVANEDEMLHVENAFVGAMISVRNEVATYVSLRALLQGRMNVERAESDKKRLGELLLDGASLGNRELMALVIRVEERELIRECLGMINQWSADLEDKGETFLPPDSTI